MWVIPIFLFCSFGLICPTNKTEYALHLPFVWAVRKADTLRVGRSGCYEVISVLASGQHHARNYVKCILLWFGQSLYLAKGRGGDAVFIRFGVTRRNPRANARRWELCPVIEAYLMRGAVDEINFFHVCVVSCCCHNQHGLSLYSP